MSIPISQSMAHRPPLTIWSFKVYFLSRLSWEPWGRGCLPTLVFPNNEHSPQSSSETSSQSLLNKQKASSTWTSTIKPEMLSPSSENPRHMISLPPSPLTPTAVTTHCLVVWLNAPVWCPPLDCECLRTRDQSSYAAVILIVLSPISNTWHVYSNNLFKKINKDVGLSLSVPSNVGGVMRGSYNSLMLGNTTETAFYRLELGKDVRM